MTADQFNGLFEMVGGLFILLNIRRLHADKEVKGMDWRPLVFFTSWGLWNLVYYPHLEQWWSLAGGLFLSLANSVWLGQVWYYRRLGARRRRAEYMQGIQG